MSKSDTPLSEIDTERAHAQKNEPSWHGDAPIHGWDTETTEPNGDHPGRVFMLSVAPDGYGGKVYDATDLDSETWDRTERGDTLPTKALVDILTRERYRSGVNVWFNMGFDADVIFAGLNDDALRELRLTNSTDALGFHITYIPGKVLRLRDGSGHTYDHYDVAQILASFGGSLEDTAADWLGESKADDGLDKDRFTDREYLRENWNTLTRYARKDAVLVRDMWAEFTDLAEDIGVPCGRPYSTGYLAGDWLRAELDAPLGWGSNAAQSMAWDSYAGGRFEVFERGDVGDVVIPDINSAYPHVMRTLPDPGTLRWEQHGRGTRLTELRDADYGFVDVTVTTDASRRIQPFAVKVDGKVKYPALSDHRLTVIKDILVWAVKEGIVTDYTVHKAALGHERPATYYPFGPNGVDLAHQYDQRKTWADDGRDKAAQTLKIVLNSLYGKTTQTTVKQREPTERVDMDSLGRYESLKVTDDGVGLITEQVAGRWFNPFISTYTTGLTRLELHKAVVEHGLERDTVMLATDSIMVRADAFERSDFAAELIPDDSVSYADQLGMWDYDAKRGRGFVVGSGVYQVDLPDWTKTGTRGFRELAGGDATLREAAERANGGTAPATTKRPISLREAEYDPTLTPADVGKFVVQEKALTADFDDKRAWDRENPTFDDLLSGAERSNPLKLYRGDSRKAYRFDGEIRADPPRVTHDATPIRGTI